MQRNQINPNDLESLIRKINEQYENAYPLNERLKYGFFNNPNPISIKRIDLKISEAIAINPHTHTEAVCDKIFEIMDIADSQLKSLDIKQKERSFYESIMKLIYLSNVTINKIRLSQ